MKKILIKDIFYICLLLILVLVYFWPTVLEQKIPYSGDYVGSDMTEVNLAIRHSAAESWRAGEIPLWTDELSSGLPLLAESQIGFFYPLHLVFFKFLPFMAAFNWLVILHSLLGAVFFYGYLRLIKISSAGSFLGALSFIFSGFFVGHAQHVNIVAVAVWLPALFSAVELALRKKKISWLFGISIILASQLLIGHWQIIYYSIIAIILYFFWRLLFINYEREGEPQLIYSLKDKVRFCLIFICSLAFGLALAAVQILPTTELTRLSWRDSPLTFEDANQFSYQPKNLITFILPYFFGNPAQGTYFEDLNKTGLPWENMGYFGILPLLGSFYAIFKFFKIRNLRAYFFMFLAVVGLLILLGINGSVFQLLWAYLPGFSHFRAHTRVLLLIIFSLTVLSSFGFDLLIKKFKALSWKRIYISLLVGVLFFFSIIDLFYFGWRYNAFISGPAWLDSPRSADFLKQDDSYFRIYSLPIGAAYKSLLAQGEGWLKDQRLLINNRELLEPNTNALFSLASIDELIGLRIKRSFRLFYVLDKAGLKPDPWSMDFPKEREISLTNQYLKILGMQNAKYLLSFFNLSNENLKLVHSVDFPGELMLPLNIYQNNFFLPRAYLVGAVNVMPTDNSALQDLKIIREFYQEDFDFKKIAIVEEPIVMADRDLESSNRLINSKLDSRFHGNDRGTSDGIQQAVIKEWNNGIIKIAVSGTVENFLVVSNTYYPGWQATIDGQAAKIYRANYLFQGLVMPAGEHLVELNYKPRSYEIGKRISLASWGLLIIYFLGYGVTRIKKRVTPSNSPL